MLGQGEPAVVFSPTRPDRELGAWKAQVPYLARSSRVVNIDPRGNGRRTGLRSSAGYADTEFVADTIAVMDAIGVERAVLVGLCSKRLVRAADGGAASRPGARRREHRRHGCRT